MFDRVYRIMARNFRERHPASADRERMEAERDVIEAVERAQRADVGESRLDYVKAVAEIFVAYKALTRLTHQDSAGSERKD